MKAIEIEAYKTSDGNLFEAQRDADSHQLDILGECLDDLLPDDNGNITRADRHRLLLSMLADKKLLEKLLASYQAANWPNEGGF